MSHCDLRQVRLESAAKGSTQGACSCTASSNCPACLHIAPIIMVMRPVMWPGDGLASCRRKVKPAPTMVAYQYRYVDEEKSPSMHLTPAPQQSGSSPTQFSSSSTASSSSSSSASAAPSSRPPARTASSAAPLVVAWSAPTR